jgi:copper transport protein
MMWTGALLPLAAAAADRQAKPSRRILKAAWLAVVILVLSGATLAVLQLDRIDALWTTAYGIVLSLKLAAIAGLIALACLHHDRAHTRPAARFGRRSMARIPAIELGIVVAILALVVLWRFTPPPRALAAAGPIELHLHGQRAMVQLTLIPERARPPRINIQVLDGEFRPLTVKEVTLNLASPAIKIEPIRRAAVRLGDAMWRVEGLRVPQAGRWVVRVDLLIDDFDKVVLEEEIELPRLP